MVLSVSSPPGPLIRAAARQISSDQVVVDAIDDDGASGIERLAMASTCKS